jgi:hypothetical protein
MLMMDQVRYVLKFSLASFVGLLLIDMFFLNRMLMEFILKDSYLICLANIVLRYQGSQNRWEPVRFGRFPVEPVRLGT